MYKGDFPTGATIPFLFSTYSSNDPAASITMTGLAAADIEVFKNGGATARASDNGYTLLDTDGTDFAGITGVHGVSIDTSDNSDAGFYAAGNEYDVVISSITVDGGVVSFIAGSFSIERSGGALALIKARLPNAVPGAAGGVMIAGSNAATTMASYTVTGAMTLSDGLIVNRSTSDVSAIVATGNGTGHGVEAVSGSGATGDGISATAVSTNGRGLRALGNGTGGGIRGDGGASGVGIRGAGGGGGAAGIEGVGLTTGPGIRGRGGTTSGEGIRGEASGGNTAGIIGVGLGSGAGIRANGGNTAGPGIRAAGGTNGDGILAAKNGTGVDIRGAITGDVTGNLSGSVGSVTGAVGSVTGAVGSVTGNVGGTINGLTATALADFFDTDSGTTYGAAVAGSVVKETADNASGASLTEAGIADAVWDEDIVAAHATADTAGLIVSELTKRSITYSTAVVDGSALGQIADDGTAVFNRTTDSLQAIADSGGGGPTAAQIADAVWDEDKADHTTATSFGDLATDLDSVLTDTADMQPKLGTPAGADMSADIASIQTDTTAIVADTNELQTDWADAGRLDAILDARASQASVDALNDLSAAAVNAEVDSALNTAIPGVPTAGSVNDVLKDLDARLPGSGTLSTLVAADINAEVVDVIRTDTLTQPGSGIPSATPTLSEAVMFIHKAWRNRHTQDGSDYKLYNDDATTVDQKASVSDNGTVFDRGEVASGP